MDGVLDGVDENEYDLATTSPSETSENFDISDSNATVSLQEQQRQHDTTNGASSVGSNNTMVSSATGGEKKIFVNLEDKIKVEQLDLDGAELLGSVTTHNCPGTRTSARVIQKMKQDQTRPSTPPPNEREHRKDDRNIQKTPSQMRSNKPSWTNLERNHFFDALNEFGKEFDAIGNFINSKLKRKSATDTSFKTKDQVRQHYYQTFHKICKYIKFSEEIKKPAQELYALINYGEMRRKLQFVTDKHFMKLRNLVYQGHITVRCKGKNIRVKTPSCKALRRLNQLDDSLEDIRLPSKIEVIISPANMESFGRVQAMAQNPRARTTVPLHKKLSNFIKTFQYKWRSAEMKLAEEEARLFPSPQTAQIGIPAGNTELNDHMIDCFDRTSAVPGTSYRDAEMCFLPKPGVPIHRPLLSITEYLSSMNICLTAYEERMGVKTRGDILNQDRGNIKRQRTDSGSEKRSPDAKKTKQLGASMNSPLHEKCMGESLGDCESIVNIKEEALKEEHSKSESSGDELNDEINELLSDSDMLRGEELNDVIDASKTEEPLSSLSSLLDAPALSSSYTASQAAARSKRHNSNTTFKSSSRNAALIFKPLLSEDVSKRIRKGWTVSNAADITIGDLYVVLGQDSRLELEYYWTDGLAPEITTTIDTCTENTIDVFIHKHNGMPYNPTECDDPNLLKTLGNSGVGNKLKHLLLIANLSERIRKRQQCSCGHTCERGAVKTKIERDMATKTFVSTKTFTSTNSPENNSPFRQPVVPLRRPVYNLDPVKQLTALTRPKLSRQVLVQRLLLPGGSNHSYDLLDVNNLQNHFSKSNGENGCTDLDSAKETSNATGEPSDTLDASDATTMRKLSKEIRNLPDESSENVPAAENCNFAGVLDNNTNAAPSAKPHAVSGNTEQQQGRNKQQGHEVASLPDSAFDEGSNNSSLFNSIMSPMNLLRESTSNSRWLEENLNDFSLTSLLGHLDEINANRDILDPSSNLSVISESSVDFMHKFQEITALMQNQDKD